MGYSKPTMSAANMHYLLLHDSSVPMHDDWLGPGEREVLAGLRFAKRRHDWRLGRWTVKRALVAQGYLGPESLSQIEIRAADDGAPELFGAGAALPITISISHRGPWGLAAVGSVGVQLGCDLEQVEAKTDSFLRDYFTESELALAQADPSTRDRIAMVIWAGKEAALKAVRTGLRRDTRSMEVDIGTSFDSEWAAITVRDHLAERSMHGAWRSHGDYVFATVCEPWVTIPMPLTATV